MVSSAIDIPAAWQAIDPGSLSGVVMLIGETDSGKSTFARYLYRRLVDSGRRVVFLDGDPGQTFLGPPGSITAAFSSTSSIEEVSGLPLHTGLKLPGEELSSHPVLRSFIGSTTPARSLLPMLVGVQRLVQAARSVGTETLIYDTDGMVEPRFGGAFLKLSLVDLLRPQAVIAIQKKRVLDPILAPLRKSHRTHLVELNPSPAVKTRSRLVRRSHRQEMFARFFSGARPLLVHWPRLAVFPAPHFRDRQLIALEDTQGFLLGLGIVLEVDSARRTVSLLYTLPSLEGVDALRLGDVLVDPVTFSDMLMG